MPKYFSEYPYQNPVISRAGLSNLRDDDLLPGGQICRGEILAGKCGYFVAETNVSGYSPRDIIEYLPNRCCRWQQEFFLTCMALDGLPKGPVPRGPSGGLRHRHCVVAEITSPIALAKAKALGLPVISASDGRKLANLEIASIPQRQPFFRRAKLL
jgi:hypothetical protein